MKKITILIDDKKFNYSKLAKDKLLKLKNFQVKKIPQIMFNKNLTKSEKSKQLSCLVSKHECVKNEIKKRGIKK